VKQSEYGPTFVGAVKTHDDTHGRHHLLSNGSRHAGSITGTVRLHTDVVYQLLHTQWQSCLPTTYHSRHCETAHGCSLSASTRTVRELPSYYISKQALWDCTRM